MGTKLYEGFMASDYYTHPGSGYNYLCMHPQPQWPSGMSTGNQDGALLYGVEYENTGAVDKNSQKDAGCAVCEHKTAASVYVQWGRRSCTNGHNTLCWGVIMANRYNHQAKSMYICVDWDRAYHSRSSNANHNGGLLYTTEMQTNGHSSGDEQQYGHDRELSCAVCNPRPKNTVVYTRWGSRSCPSGTTKLYEGFVASDYYTHAGSGANYLCMHPKPEFPPGMSTGNQDGALIYGVEYENTGAVDKNAQKDAACAVCQRMGASSVYVQWGRQSCTNGHRREYWGLLMADRYTHKKSEYICVDWERAPHKTSSNSNHNGGLLYTTEMQTNGHSSGDEAQYGHDRELSCAVCSSSLPVYTRWGSRTCANGATKLYEGFMANDYYTHPGSGYNYLCIHPQPQWPSGMSTWNQDGALLHGVEYENTGAVDKNYQKDAACAVCQQKSSTRVPYVQWGRKSCSNGHKLEYYGLIMANR